MDKEPREKKPSVAPGDEEALEVKASKEDIKRGDYTKGQLFPMTR